MLNECLLYIQFFRLKKTDLDISTRSISEILTLFKKFAVMYNLNLEIHSGWSFKQYFKFDYRMSRVESRVE